MRLEKGIPHNNFPKLPKSLIGYKVLWTPQVGRTQFEKNLYCVSFDMKSFEQYTESSSLLGMGMYVLIMFLLISLPRISRSSYFLVGITNDCYEVFSA